MAGRKLHVAILSSPGMGHLIPVLLLGNRLITHHNVDVTVLVVTTQASPAESEIIGPLTARNNIPIIKIPSDISHLVDSNTKVVAQLGLYMQEAISGIRSAIFSMNPRPDLLIGDLFSTEAWPIAEEFGMPKYVFVTSTAWFTALTAYCHVLDKVVEGQYVDQKEPLKIPGCKPVRQEDVVDPMLDRNDQQYDVYVKQGIGYTRADGILINTWEDLEPESLYALRNDKILQPVVRAPIYPIGPMYRAHEPVAGSKSKLIEWLDTQPVGSVLYVSFGSGGTMSEEQMTELAFGLELSQQSFIWVVRPPAGQDNDGSFFSSGSGPDETPDYLPEGFLTRIKNLGVVVPLWAAQVEVLNHPSVGGFLSHCGWNSTLESIISEVSIIAWPLYAEQRLNATILTEELKVAVRPAVLPTKKVVGRYEIEKMVRTLMQDKEGTAMREKVKELRHGAEEALSVHGSSYKSMCEMLKDCWARIKSP